MKLHQIVEQYITLKQSLGFRFRTETRILKGFSKAMGKVSVSQISPVAVRTYSPNTQHSYRDTFRLLLPFVPP